MFDRRSPDESLTSPGIFGPLHIGYKNEQPTVQELKQAIRLFNGRRTGESTDRDGLDDPFLCGAKADPPDFKKKLGDMDIDTLEMLATPNRSNSFSPEQSSRIRSITADEIRSLKSDANKVSKLSPALIRHLKPEAILGFIDPSDQVKPNRYIDLLTRDQQEALRYRLEVDPAFTLFLKSQGPKVQADVKRTLDALKENLGIADKKDTTPGGSGPAPAGGDPLSPRTPIPIDVQPRPKPEPFTPPEIDKLAKLVQEFKDCLNNGTFKDWCGPKGEKLAELSLLLDKPGGGENLKQLEALIGQITPEQFRQLTPDQMAGLTPAIIARMNPHTLIAMTDKQMEAMNKHQLQAIKERIDSFGPDVVQSDANYAHFQEIFNKATKRVGDDEKSWYQKPWAWLLGLACCCGAPTGALSVTLLLLLRKRMLENRNLWYKGEKDRLELEKQRKEANPDAKPDSLRGDKMSDPTVRKGFKASVFRVAVECDPRTDSKGSGERLTTAMTTFIGAYGLDERLGKGEVGLKVEFSDSSVAPSAGLTKAHVDRVTIDGKPTIVITFPKDATKAEIAQDCYCILHEIERNASGKNMSPDDRLAIQKEAKELVTSEDVAKVADRRGTTRETSDVRPREGGPAPEVSYRDGRLRIGSDERAIEAKQLIEDMDKVCDEEMKKRDERMKQLERDGLGGGDEWQKANRELKVLEAEKQKLAEIRRDFGDPAKSADAQARAERLIQTNLDKPGAREEIGRRCKGAESSGRSRIVALVMIAGLL